MSSQRNGRGKDGGSTKTTLVWADEPVSDAEMVSMAEATTTTDNSDTMNITADHPGNQSRSDILQEAIVDVQLREMRQQQQRAKEGIGSIGSEKGEKRGREESSESDGSNKRETYAEMAGTENDWSEMGSNNKVKKKPRVTDSMFELMGTKNPPQREIFVLDLDFSRCRKTEQLESMVKVYCKKRDINVLYAKAFMKKSDPKTANCKISVNETDAGKVLTTGFWPGYAFARNWYNNFQTKNDRSSEEDEHTD